MTYPHESSTLLRRICYTKTVLKVSLLLCIHLIYEVKWDSKDEDVASPMQSETELYKDVENWHITQGSPQNNLEINSQA